MEPLKPAASGKVNAPEAQAVTSHTINLDTEGGVNFEQTIKMKVPGSGMTVFNRYKLERILGRGGMGVVWLADDLKLERPVALKFLPSLIGLDPAAVKELKVETRRGLELSHPNIVRIYDFVDDDDAAAISMEFVDGKTLSELRMTTKHGVFTVADVSRWLPGVCDALDYAHFQRKVVHRDLKPANIMLTTKEEVAKVADFGIARSLSDTMSRLSAAHIGTSGTLPYMSPQQAMGERPLPTDDVYSLGATIYELLAGKPPFYRGDLPTQINSKIAPLISERRQELEIHATDPIPKEWEDAISACLNKDPNMRPSCAGMLAEMLGLKTTSGVPTRTMRSANSAFTTSQRPPSKAPMAVAAAAVLALAGGAFLHFAGQDSGKPSVTKDASAPVPSKEEPPPVLGPKTPVTAANVAKTPAAETTTPKAAASDNAPKVADTTAKPPVATPPAAQPAAPMAAAGAGAPPATPAPYIPAGSPSPASSLTAANAKVPPAIVPPATAASVAMPLTPDSAPSVIAAATPPTPVPGPTPAFTPGLSMPAGALPAAPATGQTVTLPPVPLPPDAPPDTPPNPPVIMAMPAQQVVADPASGFWNIDQMFPMIPFANYSPNGKRYLLYRVQGSLKERGLYTSSVDGKEGKSTHNAIQLFQAKSGLRPNGLLDIPTLAALQLSVERDNYDWVAPVEAPSGGPRRASGGGRYGRSSSEDDDGPGFLERTGGKIKNLFK